MTCEELYERLTELAEGSLQGDACADVERHLAECGDCRQFNEDLKDLARLCREAQKTAATMPVEVRRRIEVLLSVEDADGRARPSRS